MKRELAQPVQVSRSHTNDRQQRVRPYDFSSDHSRFQFSCTHMEDASCAKTCCKSLISLTFLKKSFAFWYSLRRQVVFFGWIDTDFMSKHISCSYFVGLLNCSVCSVLLTCFSCNLFLKDTIKKLQRIKHAEIRLKNISNVLLVSPFGSKCGYSCTYKHTCTYSSKSKIVLDTFWLEQMFGSRCHN